MLPVKSILHYLTAARLEGLEKIYSWKENFGFYVCLLQVLTKILQKQMKALLYRPREALIYLQSIDEL